jgi:hypothetical protein
MWGQTVNVSTTRGPNRARFGRYLLSAMLVLVPVTLIPIALAGSASAASPTTTLGAAQTVSANDVTAGLPEKCAQEWTWWVSSPTVNADGTASITVVPDGCSGAPLTLVAYSTHGPTFATAGDETREGFQTLTVTGATTFKVSVPSCYYQLDLVTGVGADTPLTIPAGETYFSNHSELLSYYNGGVACVLPTTSSTTPPTTTTSTPPPVTTTTTAPPTTTTTTTAPPTTTTTTTAPPTSVLATETTKSTDGATTPTTSSTLVTSVQGESFTKSPDAAVAATAASLPFTGSSLPVGPTIALAIELIVAGGAVLMLVSGRRRSAGSHR